MGLATLSCGFGRPADTLQQWKRVADETRNHEQKAGRRIS
jgi:hypothetical protein